MRKEKVFFTLLLCWLLAMTAAVANGSADGGKKDEGQSVVTLSVFSMPSNYSGLAEGWWVDILRNEVGVDLEIIPSGDQGEQKLQALMAGGELPDIVVFKSKKQIVDAVRADMLLCMDDHIDQLPNARMKVPMAMQFYRDTVSNDTGKLYAIPNDVGPAAIGETFNWGPYLRYDLYRKLGSPELETLEDYLPLLKDMQDLEPVNEDGQKVYGLTMWSDWDATSMHQASTTTALTGGADDQILTKLPFFALDLVTGETGSTLTRDSEYMRVIKFMFDANQMGLVDPDSLSQRFDSAKEKFNQGRILFSWWSWLSGGYNTPEHVNGSNPRGFELVSCNDAKVMAWGENPVGKDWAFAIGAETKYEDKALAYVDYMFSDKGLFNLMNGPQGIVWDMDASGSPVVTDEGWDIIQNNSELPGGGKLSDGVGVVNSYGLSAATVNSEYALPINHRFWESSMGKNPSDLQLQWREDTGYDYNSAYLFGEEQYATRNLAISMIPVMDDDMNQLTGQIGDMVKTYSWRLVFAEDETDFENTYEEMLEKVNGLGLDNILEWDSQAWEQALETAAKYE